MSVTTADHRIGRGDVRRAVVRGPGHGEGVVHPPHPSLGGFLAGVGAQRPTVVLEVMRGGGPEVT